MRDIIREAPFLDEWITAAATSGNGWAWLKHLAQGLNNSQIRNHERNYLQTMVKILKIISGWWFGTFFLFSPIFGMMIQSDELIFFRGVAQPPTRFYMG